MGAGRVGFSDMVPVCARQVATRELIDTSFRKLRSAEGAFELFLSFKKIQSKGAIQQQMMSKFVDILEQFSREIDLAQDIFETNKNKPPLTRNQPPVAGAIKWSRSVFSRVKHTFNSLRVMETELMDEQVGRDVHEKYMSLAKQMMYFEKHWFSNWSETIDKVAMEHLKQPILREDASGRISVNFHEDLIHLIRETRYLDRMGFKIPEVALNVTLQASPAPSMSVPFPLQSYIPSARSAAAARLLVLATAGG